jgi:hypothetical protein
LGPYCQASTAQAKRTVGNEPNSQSRQWVFPSWSCSFKSGQVNSQGHSHEYIGCTRKPSYKQSDEIDMHGWYGGLSTKFICRNASFVSQECSLVEKRFSSLSSI